jgi:hypothetical protein
MYMQGSGKDSVSGHVTRWHVQNGVETIDASEYISSLEEEIKKLQKQAESRAGEVCLFVGRYRIRKIPCSSLFLWTCEFK